MQNLTDINSIAKIYIDDRIPFSTVRKRQKPEECLVYASSGFCGMAKMLYGNIILKFF